MAYDYKRVFTKNQWTVIPKNSNRFHSNCYNSCFFVKLQNLSMILIPNCNTFNCNFGLWLRAKTNPWQFLFELLRSLNGLRFELRVLEQLSDLDHVIYVSVNLNWESITLRVTKFLRIKMCQCQFQYLIGINTERHTCIYKTDKLITNWQV